jgi:hypothetical protein
MMDVYGPQGYQGKQGRRGALGAQGQASIVGAQGDVGLLGFQGRLGDRGFQGLMAGFGPQGPKGITIGGAQGFDAINGLVLTGPQGIIGQQGSTVTAVQAAGSQGKNGNQGLAGMNGVQGLFPQGVQGAAGNAGAQGFNGTDGGTSGVQGPAGVENTTQGFQGSDLVGFEGAQGPRGLETVGSQGLAGTDGAQGFSGMDGTRGVQGFIGTQGGYFHTTASLYDGSTDLPSGVAIPAVNDVTPVVVGTFGQGSSGTVQFWFTFNGTLINPSANASNGYRVDITDQNGTILFSVGQSAIFASAPFVYIKGTTVLTFNNGDYAQVQIRSNFGTNNIMATAPESFSMQCTTVTPTIT